jgi:uncharacterized membrane protein
MRFLLRHFLRGLLVVVPLVATVWILLTAFVWIDELIQPPPGGWQVPLTDWTIDGARFAQRGFGFLVTVVLITLIGFLTSNVLTRWIFKRIDRLFTHVPVVKQVYSTIKDMIEAFVSDQKRFDKPVLLSFGDTPEVEVIGFVTRDTLAEFGRAEKVAVYVPQSYNFAANLILVPRERVRPIDLPSADVMAFVVSGGVTSADREGGDGES